jgi:hypothetical protein
MKRTRSHSRPRPKEVIIAIMGMTGVGKSSFIQRVTRSKDIHISHSLAPGIYFNPPQSTFCLLLVNAIISSRVSKPQSETFTYCFLFIRLSTLPWPVFHTSLDSVLKERRYSSDLIL